MLPTKIGPQLWKNPEKLAFELIFEQLNSLSTAASNTVLQSLISFISSEEECDNTPMLRLIIQLLTKSAGTFPPDHPFFVGLFKRLFSIADHHGSGISSQWRHSLENEVSQKPNYAISEFLTSVPSSVLLSQLIICSQQDSLHPYNSIFLARSLPKESTLQTIFKCVCSCISLRPSNSLLQLLLLSYAIGESEYFDFLLNTGLSQRSAAESVFQISLQLFPYLPVHVAASHINKLRILGNNASSAFESFKKSMNENIGSENGSASSALMTGPSTSIDAQSLAVDKWTSQFENTSKPPLKELAAMKIFSPALLAASLEALLVKTQKMDAKAPGVQLVLQLSKSNYYRGKSYERWLEKRMDEERLKSCDSKPKPAIPSLINVNATIEDLRTSLATWAKNKASGALSTIGSMLSSLLVRSNGNQEEVNVLFELIWRQLSDSSSGDWIKKTNELDKFLTATIVPQAMYFYPMLQNKIMMDLKQNNPDMGIITMVLTTISSHDRHIDRMLLHRIWCGENGNDGILELPNKPCLQNCISLMVTILRSTIARFKSIAVAPAPPLTDPPIPSTTNGELESLQRRMGILDTAIVQFMVWAASKQNFKTGELRFATAELSELLRHHLIKPACASLSSIPLDRFIHFEARSETLDNFDATDFKRSLISKVAECSPDDSHSIDTLRLLSKSLLSIPPEDSSSVTQILRQTVIELANRELQRVSILSKSTSEPSVDGNPAKSTSSKDIEESEPSNWILDHFSVLMEQERPKTTLFWESWFRSISLMDNRWWVTTDNRASEVAPNSLSRILTLFTRVYEVLGSLIASKWISNCILGILDSSGSRGGSEGATDFCMQIVAQSPLIVSSIASHESCVYPTLFSPESRLYNSTKCIYAAIHGVKKSSAFSTSVPY